MKMMHKCGSDPFHAAGFPFIYFEKVFVRMIDVIARIEFIVATIVKFKNGVAEGSFGVFFLTEVNFIHKESNFAPRLLKLYCFRSPTQRYCWSRN